MENLFTEKDLSIEAISEFTLERPSQVHVHREMLVLVRKMIALKIAFAKGAVREQVMLQYKPMLN